MRSKVWPVKCSILPVSSTRPCPQTRKGPCKAIVLWALFVPTPEGGLASDGTDLSGFLHAPNRGQTQCERIRLNVFEMSKNSQRSILRLRKLVTRGFTYVWTRSSPTVLHMLHNDLMMIRTEVWPRGRPSLPIVLRAPIF
jgi:hypothetical protein